VKDLSYCSIDKMAACDVEKLQEIATFQDIIL
jgi:hypothetical protein